ncbi:unnamed protein product [Moneuplotes crassus]|uniref:Uncharacterized protein n=2 Tax=Euplotes crassus TaxID=5936 RepID=A0AAD2DBR3_EUPCR|nr:unnamed protein product [Moneuplotes crassus]
MNLKENYTTLEAQYSAFMADEEEAQVENIPSPVKYDRYPTNRAIPLRTCNNNASLRPKERGNKLNISVQHQSFNDLKICSTLTNSNKKASKDYPYRETLKGKDQHRMKKNILCSTKTKSTLRVQTDCHLKSRPRSKIAPSSSHSSSSYYKDTSINKGKKKVCKKPLNFRSIDQKNQSKHKKGGRGNTLKSYNSTKCSKNSVSKSEKIKKNHISYICRRNPMRFRIIAFAQVVAAKRIQRAIREFTLAKKEAKKRELEDSLIRIRENRARKVIYLRVSTFFLKKKHFREILIQHQSENLNGILLIQRRFRHNHTKLKKMNIPRFKQLFAAFLIGWKVRRVMTYLKTLPEIKEAVDFIKLRNDIKDEETVDLFSQRIIQQYPEKAKFFHTNFTSIYSSGKWFNADCKETQAPKKKICKSRAKAASKICKKSKKLKSNPSKFSKNKNLTKHESVKTTKEPIHPSKPVEKKPSKPNCLMAVREKSVLPTAKADAHNNTIGCINVAKTNLHHSKPKKKFARPTANKRQIDITGDESPKQIKRDKSGNLFSCNRSKLHTIEEYRTARKKRNSSLSNSFNHSSLNALDALKSKKIAADPRASYDTVKFRSTRNKGARESKTALNYSNRLAHQNTTVINQNSDLSILQDSVNYEKPQTSGNDLCNSTISSSTKIIQYGGCKKKVNYDSLGLAANLIKTILEQVNSDPSLQLSVLCEVQNMIGKPDQCLASQSKSTNLNLRRSIKKFSNNDNNTIEYEVTVSHIQDLLRKGDLS